MLGGGGPNLVEELSQLLLSCRLVLSGKHSNFPSYFVKLWFWAGGKHSNFLSFFWSSPISSQINIQSIHINAYLLNYQRGINR